MSRHRKFTTICCAAVFALGLAACGGGGDDGLNTSQEQELQNQKEAAENQVAALTMQINALRAQLGLDPADDLDAEVQDLQNEVTRLKGEVQKAQDAQMTADMKAMVATAAKLYAGISVPTANNDGNNSRHAAYGSDNVLAVTIGTDDNAGTAVDLAEDKDAMVTDNHGWQGKRYTRSKTGEGMYEAMVYSNVEDPRPGRMFGDAEPGIGAAQKYEYMLEKGRLTAPNAGGVGGTSGFIPARVAFTDVTRTAGTETFEKGSNDVAVMIPGSYHGVSGTYSCTPDAGNSCSATAVSKGFTLSDDGDVWTFRPGNADARVMDAADTIYASYGWWIHKAANDGKFTASAFTAVKGTYPASAAVDELDALEGTATYMGGAAGKYALSSSTGGTNDAGHFTAMVTLEADFNANTSTNTNADPAPVGITGMIDNFMGEDGEMRNWSVKLKGSAISNDGAIGAPSDGTTWTIDGSAAKASGNWSGMLQNTGKDGVPQVATGTFYTEYTTGSTGITAGKMVGAFGANVDLQQ